MRRLLRSALRAIYEFLFGFDEFYDRRHLFIAGAEFVVALFVTIRFFSERLEVIREQGMLNGIASLSFNDWLEVGEFVAFLVLTASIAARLALLLRRRFLGMDFGLLARTPQPFDHDALQLAAGKGYRGAPVPATSAATAIRQFTEQSASTLSVRTYGGPDEKWLINEQLYLAGWQKQMPECLWRLSEGDGSFISVVVPILHDSFEKIERGHLSTALPTLNLGGPEKATDDGGDTVSANLLIYGVVATGANPGLDSQALMVACCLEHLSYIIRKRFGLSLREPNAQVRFIVESSSAALNDVLSGLGFHPVLGRSHEPGRPSRNAISPAGFDIFEASFMPDALAKAADDNDGPRIFELVRRYLELPMPAVELHEPALSATPEPPPLSA